LGALQIQGKERRQKGKKEKEMHGSSKTAEKDKKNPNTPTGALRVKKEKATRKPGKNLRDCGFKKRDAPGKKRMNTWGNARWNGQWKRRDFSGKKLRDKKKTKRSGRERPHGRANGLFNRVLGVGGEQHKKKRGNSGKAFACTNRPGSSGPERTGSLHRKRKRNGLKKKTMENYKKNVKLQTGQGDKKTGKKGDTPISERNKKHSLGNPHEGVETGVGQPEELSEGGRANGEKKKKKILAQQIGVWDKKGPLRKEKPGGGSFNAGLQHARSRRLGGGKKKSVP